MGRRPAARPAPGEFAGAFRDLVASTGLPLDRLADRVGRSATTLSRYQTGQGLPDHTVLAAVHREATDPVPLADLAALLDRARGGAAPGWWTRTRRLAVAAVVVVAAAAGALLAVTVTGASDPMPDTFQVCAADLLVRSAPRKPAEGARRLGLLRRGDTFDRTGRSADGVYAYGLAHGDVGRHGWVDAQWLCRD